MKSILNDEKGILTPTLTTMFYLFLIIIMYFIGMPLLWGITNVLISMGAPADIALFYMRIAQYGFILFAIAVLLVWLAKVWKSTHDTQQFGGGF